MFFLFVAVDINISAALLGLTGLWVERLTLKAKVDQFDFSQQNLVLLFGLLYFFGWSATIKQGYILS